MNRIVLWILGTASAVVLMFGYHTSTSGPQATTPVPEWGEQGVRMAQEEDAIVGADGKVRWALRRQDRLFLVK